MGFFSDALSFVGDVFTDNTGDIIGAGIGLAGNLIGSNRQRQATTQAANTIQASTSETLQFQAEQAEIARAIFEEALASGLDDLDAGSITALQEIGIGAQQALAAFREVKGLSDQGLVTVRQTAASDPGVLFDSQQIAIDDTRRDLQQSLDRSALRSSGRAQAAVHSDVLGRMRADFEDRNRARRDQAAQFLASENLGARRDIANVGTSASSDRANIALQRTGDSANLRQGFAANAAGIESDLSRSTTTARNAGANAVANAQANNGLTSGNAAIANAQLIGQTVGSSIDPLRHVVAEEQKKARDSRFLALTA